MTKPEEKDWALEAAKEIRHESEWVHAWGADHELAVERIKRIIQKHCPMFTVADERKSGRPL